MKNTYIKILSLFVLVAMATTAFAQEEAEKKDNSGTNPINFTYDYRLYTEWQQFTDNGGSQNRTVMELRAPLCRDLANVFGKEGGVWGEMGSRFQLRIRGILQHR